MTRAAWWNAQHTEQAPPSDGGPTRRRRHPQTMAPTRRPWGGYDICHGRHGMTRYRLVVCPPGITAGRRRRLVLWRNWPLWGAALWVGLELFARHETVWKRVYEEVGV